MKTVTYDETLWQIVPIEPTDEMFMAGYNERSNQIRNDDESIVDVYKAMLSAAPNLQDDKP